jgi:hypothetical protein
MTRYQCTVDELCIGNATGQMTRADVVGLDANALHGYELKGDGDTLKRVPLQLLCYSKVFSRVSFVVTSKHLAKLLPMLPEWVGVYEASAAGVECLRPAGHNPEQDKYWLSGLLWGEELRELCKRYNIPAKAKWRVWESQEALAACEAVTLAVLESFVASCLLKRMKGKLRRREIAKAIRAGAR